MSKRIELTQGKYALVDDADFEWLNYWNWYAHKEGKNYYARRCYRFAGQKIIIIMHREILGLKNGDKIRCDHIDTNGLNNQRSNLRFATAQQNMWNRKSPYGSTSFYLGVSLHKRQPTQWRASIFYNGKNLYLGLFDNEIEAAKIRDRAALKYRGEFAKLNFGRRLHDKESPSPQQQRSQDCP